MMNAHRLPIRHVPPQRIAVWLRAAWGDLRRNPLASLSYGLLFAIGGDLILLASLNNPAVFFGALSAFFLLAPLLSAGLYVLSKQPDDIRFVDTLFYLAQRWRGLAQLGLLLAGAALLWERCSGQIFSALVDGHAVNALGLLKLLQTRPDLHASTALWLLSGGLIAALAFALTVVAVPLMVDRPFPFVAALRLSLQAVVGNPLTLMLWAATIVVLTLLGYATLLFGLIVLMPLLGHASWHAYRDLLG